MSARSSARRLLLATVATAVTIFGTSGCQDFSPYAVRRSASATMHPDGTSPTLKSGEVLGSPEYSAYRDARHPDDIYVLPTHLVPIASSLGRVACVSLERTDGDYLILTCSFAPPDGLATSVAQTLRERAIPFSNVRLYPAQDLVLRPLTDPEDNTTLRLTGMPAGLGGDLAFQPLLVARVRGSRQVVDFKSLAAREVGVIVEAVFPVRFDDSPAPTTRSVQIILGDLDISNLTM